MISVGGLSGNHKESVVFTLVFILLVMISSPAISVVAVDVSSDIRVGPYVDKVVFKVITEREQSFLALQAGEIEMEMDYFDPVHLPTLEADPDISVFKPLRNGYGHITINCRVYPLNITDFRRAFAYAFDKTRVTTEIMDGYSQEHDSVVPYVSSWCIEDEMPYHYYTAQVATGTQILEDAGFYIDPVSGFRTAPDGSHFDVIIEYGSSSPEIAGGTAQIGVDALRALDVNADTRAAETYDFFTRLDFHDDYDMVFYAYNFHSNDVQWLANEFCSDNVDSPYQNPTNFENTTFDSWIDQLLYSTDYDEVYEASYEMQMVLQYNVPRLVTYMNTYMQAYRNDKFTGHVADLGSYITGPWTIRKIHKI
ncbi:MAG: ABC transporter substrate-binding protein, partial [Candidatus Thorarchaeota archaeon]